MGTVVDKAIQDVAVCSAHALGDLGQGVLLCSLVDSGELALYVESAATLHSKPTRNNQ